MIGYWVCREEAPEDSVKTCEIKAGRMIMSLIMLFT